VCDRWEGKGKRWDWDWDWGLGIGIKIQVLGIGNWEFGIIKKTCRVQYVDLVLEHNITMIVHIFIQIMP